MTKFKDLTEEAAKYKALVLQIKELEQQATPLKKQLLQYAAVINQSSIGIGDLTIERRTTEKVLFDDSKLTPDWLYLWDENGGRCFLKIGIDRKCYGTIALGEMMEELGGVVTSSHTFAVRL